MTDILTAAERWRGTPYALPPDGTTTLDCSLYVLKVLDLLGYPLPAGVRTAEQIRQACTPVPFNQVRQGDLLFFADTYDAPGPAGPDGQIASHIGISLGAGTKQMWDANDARGNVGITNINTPYWQEHLLEARRAPIPSVPTQTPEDRPQRLKLNAACVRLRATPSTSSVILVDDLGEGTAVTPIDDYAWRQVRTSSNRVGWVAARYLSPAPADTAPSDDLSSDPDHEFSFDELRPIIESAAAEYDADPQVVAGIMWQESRFTNYRVHQDGTGHGLAGLDDNGLLPDFEDWSGLEIGRGSDAEIIPPGLQIAYLAKTVAEFSRRYGSAYNAARVWHRGPNLWHDARGQAYEELIRAHVARLYR